MPELDEAATVTVFVFDLVALGLGWLTAVGMVGGITGSGLVLAG